MMQGGNRLMINWHDEVAIAARMKRLGIALKILRLNRKLHPHQPSWGRFGVAIKRVEDLRANVLCLECENAKPRLGPCPNPACWKGLRAFLVADKAWKARRDEYVASKRSPDGIYFQPGTLASLFEQHNPRPVAADFREDK